MSGTLTRHQLHVTINCWNSCCNYSSRCNDCNNNCTRTTAVVATTAATTAFILQQSLQRLQQQLHSYYSSRCNDCSNNCIPTTAVVATTATTTALVLQQSLQHIVVDISASSTRTTNSNCLRQSHLQCRCINLTEQSVRNGLHTFLFHHTPSVCSADSAVKRRLDGRRCIN